MAGYIVNGASAIRNGDLQTSIEMSVAQQYGIAGSGPSENWTPSAWALDPVELSDSEIPSYLPDDCTRVLTRSTIQTSTPPACQLPT